MLDFLFGNIVYLIIAILVIALLIFILSGYVKAPPDMAYIISGLKKEPKILIGRAGIKIPFLERKDTLLVKQVSIDIKTNGFIPTLDFIVIYGAIAPIIPYFRSLLQGLYNSCRKASV